MEKRYGSLSRAMLAARKQRVRGERSGGRKLASPPRPLFTSLKDGMQQLVDTIVPRLPADARRISNPVIALSRNHTHWFVAPQQGSPEEFDAVMLALPAYAAAALVEPIAPELAAELGQVPYSSSVTVTLGYDMRDLALLPPGFGFLAPRSEGRRMLACTFVHVKFPHRAPPDRGIIRAFLGGSQDEAVLDLSDHELLALVRRNLREILGLGAEPLFARVYRWRRAMAQYVSGHLARVQRIEKLRRQVPLLELAGNAYRGIGVPDCIASGQQAARNALASLGVTDLQTTTS
jgi:oxygen-dependent protoporphyrinogen oxidase